MNKRINHCILCQTKKNEKLLNPGIITRTFVRCSFNIPSEKINRLIENDLPIPLQANIDDIKENSDTESNLCDHQAKWHKSCVRRIEHMSI